MLTFYHRLARWLYRYRPALWLLCVGALAAVLATIFLASGSASGRYGFGAVALLMWSVCLLTVTYGFAAPPPSVQPGSRLFARIGVRIRRGVLWSMAAVMTLLSGVVVFATSRAIGIWLRSL